MGKEFNNGIVKGKSNAKGKLIMYNYPPCTKEQVQGKKTDESDCSTGSCVAGAVDADPHTHIHLRQQGHVTVVATVAATVVDAIIS